MGVHLVRGNGEKAMAISVGSIRLEFFTAKGHRTFQLRNKKKGYIIHVTPKKDSSSPRAYMKRGWRRKRVGRFVFAVTERPLSVDMLYGGNGVKEKNWRGEGLRTENRQPLLKNGGVLELRQPSE